VQSQVIGDFTLGIAIFLHRFADLPVPNLVAPKNLFGEDLLQPGTVCISLALGDFGDGFLLSEVATKLLDKCVSPKQNLPSYFVPNVTLSYPFLYIAPVGLLSACSRSAELPEHPVGAQTPMGGRSSRRAEVARPLPLVRPLPETRPDRVQDDVPADLQQMALFLDVDRLAPPLEEVLLLCRALKSCV
jgi:hypothetical protein